MSLVEVKFMSKEMDYDKDVIRLTYHLTNNRRVTIFITRYIYHSLAGLALTKIIHETAHDINKQLKLAVPVGDQWLTFQKFIEHEFSLRVDSAFYAKSNPYKGPPISKMLAEYGIFNDELAPHEERPSRVMRLVDVGEGMLVPKELCEAILNDVPISPSKELYYAQQYMMSADDLKKQILDDPAQKSGMFQQLLAPGLAAEFKSQYLQYPELKQPPAPAPVTKEAAKDWAEWKQKQIDKLFALANPPKLFIYPELKGPQPGPDKKFIPENHKPAPHNPFKQFLPKGKKLF